MNKQIVDEILSAMIRSGEGISDLLFTVGKPPLIEAHGCLSQFPIKTPAAVLGQEKSISSSITLSMTMNGSEEISPIGGSCDCSYALKDVARFRINIFKQTHGYAIVMRQLQSQLPTLEKLGLPPIFCEIIKERTGIIFVTGAAGSGKTTTLAAMVNELNQTEQNPHYHTRRPH
jgi:twitching motility protein PilT